MPDLYSLNPKQIVMYTTKYCADCVRAKAFFDANGITYLTIPIEGDEDATRFVTEVNRGMHSVPTIVFPDGDVLVEPGWADLRKKLHK
ncbi:MAG: glutaredoxin family protein [Anaerolineae bacterium]